MGEAVSRISGISAPESLVYVGLLTPTSLAMLTGYRTRIAGVGAAALEVSFLALGEGNALVDSLLATLGVALAMMGPGAWSLDAWLSGWRRIHIPRRGE
jgi:putative oxidoreductase